MANEPRNVAVQYPGGVRARWRWSGSGQGAAVFALSEVGGRLTELGGLVAEDFEELCRAELRADTPTASWTIRFASRIFDDPAALYWDAHGLLVVKYGFETYGLDARSGELRWHHHSATPLLAILASSRLPHVLAQAELETFALDPDGSVAWRVSHSDVVTAAELVGGRLVLTSFGGQRLSLDPATGRAAA